MLQPFATLLLLLLLSLSKSANQRFRVTVKKGINGYGLRLVKLDQRVVILGIESSSPASRAGGGILKVGDAIIAVGNSPVPLKSNVRDVERLILQQKSTTIDLTILKDWQDPRTRRKGNDGELNLNSNVNKGDTSLPQVKRTKSKQQQQQQIWRYQVTLERTQTTGFGLQLRRKNNLIVIDAVLKNSPAFENHLLAPEDKIEAINNVYVYQKTLDQVINMLRTTLSVHLIVISATSGSRRESYLNVKLNMKQRGFLGKNISYTHIYIFKVDVYRV